LLIVALLQVDDLALRGTRDQDHREAVGGGIGQRGQAIEKPGRRHREADARLFGEIASDGRGITGILFVSEGEHANAGGLRHATKVRNRNARYAVNRLNAVELQRIDDEMKAIGQLLLRGGRLGCYALYCCGHLSNLPLHSCLLWPRSRRRRAGGSDLRQGCRQPPGRGAPGWAGWALPSPRQPTARGASGLNLDLPPFVSA